MRSHTQNDNLANDIGITYTTLIIRLKRFFFSAINTQTFLLGASKRTAST